MTAKKPTTLPIDKEPKLTAGVLTDEEMLALELEAEEEVEKEYKAKVSAEFKEDVKKKLKRKKLFKAGENETGDDTVSLTVDLATHSQKITLDGMEYYHGHTYKLSPEKAAVVREQMFRGDLHDAEIHGLDINTYHGRQRFAGKGKYTVNANL